VKAWAVVLVARKIMISNRLRSGCRLFFWSCVLPFINSSYGRPVPSDPPSVGSVAAGAPLVLPGHAFDINGKRKQVNTRMNNESTRICPGACSARCSRRGECSKTPATRFTAPSAASSDTRSYPESYSAQGEHKWQKSSSFLAP
jgi:hypothetical protein